MTLQHYRRSQLDHSSADSLSYFLQSQSADTSFLAQQAALHKVRQRQGKESFFRLSYKERRQWRADTEMRIQEETRKFEAWKLQMKRDRNEMVKTWEMLDGMMENWLKRLKAEGVCMRVWLEVKDGNCARDNKGGDDRADAASRRKDIEDRERILERTRIMLEKCEDLRKRGLVTPRAPTTNSSGYETSDADWTDNTY
ncbi:Protein of unknown function [Pyronema omphalodes CBS 100304]|uniref:Uncharacterized protein n=1 Tax=Pyronema omphalodes (strain CBS 100304) TaxID=1076935 RepID=U4L5W7_PYROM|nr:Protein of unknown function [Pyronema omphalodes CBS 100304]